MREVLAAAQVGDDCYGEDPSINALEEKIAALTHKETALFVPSGTMANQLALLLHCQPGDEVLASKNPHILHYESGAAAAMAGVQIRETSQPERFFASDFEALIRKDSYDEPCTRLIALENTHNRGGGLVIAPDVLNEVAQLAKEHNLAVHCDGARIFNAAAALEVDISALTTPCDTVSICFSKGLGAPVGSALCMPANMRARALRLRRRLGGAMRQAGFLAVAAEYAVDNHRDRLTQDNARASALAAALRKAGLSCNEPQSNIVNIEIADAHSVNKRLRSDGVLLGVVSDQLLRAVTWMDIDDAAVATAAAKIVDACQRN